MNKEGVRKTILLVLLISILLNSLGANMSLATGELLKRELFYKDMKDELEELSGVEVKTPYPNFYLKANGKEIAREEWSSKVIYD